MNSVFSFARLGALLIKEFIQMRRDRITFAMMLGVPLLQLVLFGYAINNDPKSLPAALVATSNDPYTRAIVAALQTTGYYRFDHVAQSAEDAEFLMARGDVAFVVTIPADFGRRVERGDNPQILIEADATDPAAASGAISTLSKVASQALLRAQGMQEAASEAARGQLDVVVHQRYNPEGISQYNIVPGLLGVILQMTLVMMTSIALTRETERGTMENLLAMPSSPFEIMLGKVLPYLVVGGVQVVVVLAASKLLFAIPFTGSMSLLLTAVLVFVLALVLLGYTISTIARTQMQALQLTFFFFLPSILLSGFMFPYRGMPGWAQTFGEIFPLTHFLRITRAVMLKGAELPAVAGEIAWLVGFVALFAGVALVRFRRTLD
ncbi:MULTISPECIES: ABC transporter permease [unclassified Mesorhizobium]|uniref:ABC transporter permease n=1 Tax=unclassified Mesorhizobium TaxID=325217 RepID=UPI0003CF7FBE|nr:MULTISPECIES: ABC transporter permease [unclassified Mesorhizobium]ESX12542.1 mannose-1-phosphate guanyltransferase [Mesorhizobium sp. LSJC265A00]ESX49663.1 mannose-1-phosphate guanyltransferase [Mesorhizobium sp. LSHC424B00]ESX51157.1 mannose-1-phosphate guanyltransferase [Mesorhizobium sp. LSHC426A00]ESX65526.1 mannose-1-phosphate guanyltransferase [Mesorhizobium sp. LSHC416B00]ESX94868.1 mannose-1-phosphate guanyltransferase [Mesorhizobium sp. LNJC403B00]